ncbi:DMT family transporter [Brevibacillus humidisoli]|uniref:DMT family transporter n=1 Tax=Brevibacillus humidisoli TaxID=2895522 RepID=UPI001E42C860|nr:DMT family transporter [Brevibacillus humidisoli]UFJ41064.1 DMT family transporter [Brevibacillus humidisoli]
MSSPSSSLKGVDFLLIFVAITWGVNATVVKLSLGSGFLTLPFNSVRFLLASLISWILLLLVQRQRSWRWADIPGLFAMGMLGHTLYQYLFIEGTNLTTAGNTAILLATIPIHVAWVSILLKTERSRWYIWTGLVCSFIGILLVFASQSGVQFFSSKHFVGDVLIVCGGLVMGLYTALSKKWLAGYTPLEFSTYTMTLGTIPLLFVSAPSLMKQDWTAITAVGWGGLVFSGMFAIAICYLIWNWGLQKIGSTRTAMYGNLPPVFALLSGAIWLDEAVTFAQITGALLIIGGVLVARFGSRLPMGPKTPKAEAGA